MSHNKLITCKAILCHAITCLYLRSFYLWSKCKVYMKSINMYQPNKWKSWLLWLIESKFWWTKMINCHLFSAPFKIFHSYRESPFLMKGCKVELKSISIFYSLGKHCSKLWNYISNKGFLRYWLNICHP